MANLAEEIECAVYAFLDPVNRNETLKEHGCSFFCCEDKEKILFSNPEWLLDHYFNFSEDGKKLGRKEQEKVLIFLTEHDYGNQITIAFLCPVNRDSTRKELGCDDQGLMDHFNSLILHYALSGGAEANAEERRNNLNRKKKNK